MLQQRSVVGYPNPYGNNQETYGGFIPAYVFSIIPVILLIIKSSLTGFCRYFEFLIYI
jgi:hypothetical protein